jgi:hypothetical protein
VTVEAGEIIYYPAYWYHSGLRIQLYEADQFGARDRYFL